MSEIHEKGPTGGAERNALAITRRDAFKFSGMGLAAIALVPGLLTASFAEQAWAEPLSVSVPTDINYARRADGTLIGPSGSAASMRNLSNREVRVKSVTSAAADGWNLVQDATTSSLPNSASVTIGPESDQLNLAEYTSGGEVNDPLAWTMARSSDSAELSQLDLLTAGNVSNLQGATGSGDDPETMATAEWHLASDTVTDEILDRLDELEQANQDLVNTNTQLNTKITELETSLEQMKADFEDASNHPHEVYTSADGTVTLDTSPALVVRTSDMSLWLATDD